MVLQNQTAIVTGAASGFGEGIARRFAEAGARVVVADLDEERARLVASEIGGLALAADVSKAEDVARLVGTAIEEYGGLDVLVNNAGVPQAPQPLEEVGDEVFERLLAVNVRPIYLGARYAVPHFKERGKGVILNTASTGAVRPRPNLAWYNASKGWAVTATRAMAIELAPFGIRVNALNPVAGDTPMLRTFIDGDAEAGRQRMRDTIPLGRLLTANDLAEAALFLCSDAAAMITGVALEVDGGRCI